MFGGWGLYVDGVMFTLIRDQEVYFRADDITAGDYDALGRLMDICHGILNAIGVSTPELERMVAVARDAGAAGAKLTGAGGGGSIVALCPGRGSAVTSALRAAGFQTLDDFGR